MEFKKRNTSDKSQRKIKKLAKTLNVDAGALHILFNANWNFDDPNCYGVDGTIPEDDFKYGLDNGVLREERTFSEKEVLQWLLSSRKRVAREEVAAAFISSVLSERFDHQCLLPSYSCFLSMTPEIFESAKKENGINGLKEGTAAYDLNTLQYQRFTGAPLMTDHIAFAAFIFEAFANQEYKVTVNDKDKQALNSMLDALRNLSGDTGLTDVNNALKGIVKGSKWRRTAVLEALSLCDILQPDGLPPIRENYFHLSHCPLPSHHNSKEWRYPMCHWKGAHGVNEEAVRFWFPGFEK